MRLRTIAVTAFACLALAVPGSALASSSPTQDAYSGAAGQQGQGGEPQSTSNGNEAAPAATSSEPAAETTEESSGTLPFTGFEIALIALIAVALLAAGVLLFRRSRDAAQPQG